MKADAATEKQLARWELEWKRLLWLRVLGAALFAAPMGLILVAVPALDAGAFEEFTTGHVLIAFGLVAWINVFIFLFFEEPLGKPTGDLRHLRRLRRSVRLRSFQVSLGTALASGGLCMAGAAMAHGS